MFTSQKIIGQAITFDDVLLEPGYSDVIPADADVSTHLTARIRLQIPILSSPMDTVTESAMAIALAQEGGLGVIHKNMSIARQTAEVEKVKRSANGIIEKPATLPPTSSAREARELMDQLNVSGIPIVLPDRKLVGIVTRRDLRFLGDLDVPVSQVMTKKNLVTATGAITLGEAEKILMEKKVEKLLLVDEEFRLTGLITIKDIDNQRRFPNACKDELGRLRAGAAVGVHDYDRVQGLIDKGVDVICVDSAHGHSANVLETVREIKRQFRNKNVDIVAGNVATYEGTKALIEAGADAVKVGIGPGSICTTRVVTGVGVPQITAIMAAIEAAKETGTPIIADGGVRYSGDMTKAIAAGAHAVMLGGLLAGLDESPGQRILYRGRVYKAYRGMGSLGAMIQGSSERYRQEKGQQPEKLVPEGVEGRVPYRGPLGPFIYQLVGGLKAGMGYCGARNIEELRTKARFIQVSAAGVKESHPHDITITQEAPNYSFDFTEEDR